MDVPAMIVAEQALLQQNVALSVMKQNAQAQQAMASMLEEAILSVPAGDQGAQLDVSV